MVVQIAVWFLLGLAISRTVGLLLAMLLVFNVGGLLAITVMKDTSGAPMYAAVSIFLAITSVFYAAVIENRHQRLTLIFKAWVAAALVTAALGILGFFDAFPGGRRLHALRPRHGRLPGSQCLSPGACTGTQMADRISLLRQAGRF